MNDVHLIQAAGKQTGCRNDKTCSTACMLAFEASQAKNVPLEADRQQVRTLSAIHSSEFEQLVMSAVQQGSEELLSIFLLPLLDDLGASGYLLCHCQLLAYRLHISWSAWNLCKKLSIMHLQQVCSHCYPPAAEAAIVAYGEVVCKHHVRIYMQLLLDCTRQQSNTHVEFLLVHIRTT